MHHNFHDYRPLKGEIPSRGNGVMVSMARGQAVAFSLDNLQQRGCMFVQPGDEIYEGMIVGENARSGDMVVNPCKEKKLTNMRASGSDKNILLKPPRLLTLEIALEYIESDELVEITPEQDPIAKKSAQRGRPQARRARGRQEGRRLITTEGLRSTASHAIAAASRRNRSRSGSPEARRGPRGSVERLPAGAEKRHRWPAPSAAPRRRYR